MNNLIFTLIAFVIVAIAIAYQLYVQFSFQRMSRKEKSRNVNYMLFNLFPLHISTFLNLFFGNRKIKSRKEYKILKGFD